MYLQNLSDNDCQGGLVCFQRNGNEPVPGCDNTGPGAKGGWDYVSKIYLLDEVYLSDFLCGCLWCFLIFITAECSSIDSASLSSSSSSLSESSASIRFMMKDFASLARLPVMIMSLATTGLPRTVPSRSRSTTRATSPSFMTHLS